MAKTGVLKTHRLAFFTLLFLLYLIMRLSFGCQQSSFRTGQLVRVNGVLTEEPQVFDTYQRLRLAGFEFWTGRFPRYHYGERLEVVGRVKQKNLLDHPQIRLISSHNGFLIVRLALKLQNRLRGVYLKTLRKPLDGLVAGIVLGDKNLMDKEFLLKLNQTGTIHIMVASGMNIAMFSESFLKFLTLFFKRQKAIFFLLALIWFYSIMTGFSPPIIRAATMASLIYLSQVLGREPESGKVLWLTGAIMLFLQPQLIFDLGFQLSFAATAGLVYFQPWFQQSSWPVFSWPNFASTLAAQITTLPILLLNFGELNLVSPLINLVILWAIPLILLGGSFIGVVGLLWMKGAFAASLLVYPLLFWLEQVVLFTAKMDFFQLKLPRLSIWLGAIYYLILVGLAWRRR
jgi:competence protein ComEC